MKAYEAFSSWATMVTGVSPGWGAGRPLAGPGQLQTGLRRDPLAHRDDAAANRPADGHAAVVEQTLARQLVDQSLLALARQLISHLIEVHRSHLLSVVRFGVVFLDVVVE